MCKLFVGANPSYWESTSRSVRIDGPVTSIRMENYFWHILTELAQRDGMNLPELLTKLYHEYNETKQDLGNYTSFLRVCCIRYLSLQMSEDIPRDTTVPISSLNADQILRNESASYF